MKNAVWNNPPIYKSLSKEFWSGKRWVAFDPDKKEPENEYKCFNDYKDADDYCGGMGGDLKIRILSHVLKQLNSDKKNKKAKAFPKVDFKDLQDRYPLIVFPEGVHWQEAIRARSFFPVTWEKVIRPLKDIHLYKVFVEGNLSKTFDNFREANNAFLEMASLFAAEKTRNRIELIGEIGFEENNGEDLTFPIELYQFGFQKRRQLFIVEQVRDISSTLLMPIVYFAKYNYGRARLEFYDGQLRKTLPGVVYTGIDLSHYAG